MASSYELPLSRKWLFSYLTGFQLHRIVEQHDIIPNGYNMGRLVLDLDHGLDNNASQ